MLSYVYSVYFILLSIIIWGGNWTMVVYWLPCFIHVHQCLCIRKKNKEMVISNGNENDKTLKRAEMKREMRDESTLEKSN